MEKRKSRWIELAVALPEGCIANILSFTTPADACRLSLVSKSFCSAAESDSVWDRFLPSDLLSIISDSQSASSLLATSPSKKSLYLALSDPILIDNGKRSFQLDKRIGKKCYMLSVRDVDITCGGTPAFWKWITVPKSRFQEVAKFFPLWGFEICGRLNTRVLSPNTQYAAFLVFNMIENSHLFFEHPNLFFEHPIIPMWLSVGIYGGQRCSKRVSLDPGIELAKHEHTKVRSDRWLEIEIGEFFCSGLEDEEVWISVYELMGKQKLSFSRWRLFIEGIEIRPKK